MRSTEEILKEREEQHGAFKAHASIEKELRNIYKYSNPIDVTSVQEIGLGMILHKIARLINGGYNHQDTWEDIAGYATLVAKDMEDERQ